MIWLRERKIECNFPPTKDAITCPDRINVEFDRGPDGLSCCKDNLLSSATVHILIMSQKQWFVDGQNIKTFIWCCKSFLQCSNRKKILMEIKQAHISYEAKPRGLNFVRFVLLVRLCFLFRLKLLLPLDLFLPLDLLTLLLPLEDLELLLPL